MNKFLNKLTAAVSAFAIFSSLAPIEQHAAKASDIGEQSGTQSQQYYEFNVPSPEYPISLHDDASGDKISDWNGAVTAAGGIYSLTAPGRTNSIATVGNTELTDCVISAKIRMAEILQSFGGGIVFRHIDDQNYATLRFSGHTDSNMNVEIIKFENGSSTKLASKHFLFNSEAYYTFRAELSGSTVTAYIDDKLIFENVELGSILSKGNAGMRVFAGSLNLDEITIMDAAKGIYIYDCSLADNTLSTEIRNNSDELDAIIVCALHKDDALEKVWTEPVTLKSNSTTQSDINGITIPDEKEGYRLSVMLWEGIDSMKPISKKAVCEFNISEPTEAPTPDASYSPSVETVKGNTTADFLYRTYKGSGYSHGLDYRLYVPQTYDYTKKYPLFVYLNGAGSRGSDNVKQLSNLAPYLNPIITNEADYPCIIAVPQCPANEQWVDTPWAKGTYNQDNIPISDELAMVNEMIDSLMLEYNIDSDRLYISGQSMGGYGSWDYITRFPDKVAAAIINCGAADTSKAALIKDMPLMVLHGSADPTVPISGSRDMVTALRDLGSDVIYHEYDGVDHYVQRRLFENPSMWLDWLFAQSKNSAAEAPEKDKNTLHSVEQFNSQIPAEWASNQSSAWTIAATGDGMLKGTVGANASAAIYNTATSELMDYTASAYIKIPQAASAGSGIVVRYTNDSTLLTVRFTKGTTPGLQVVELQSGMETIMKNYPFDWSYDTLYNLKVSVLGNTLNAYLDNVQVIKDYPISRPMLKQAGAAGLRIYNGTMFADDFAVYLNNEQSLRLDEYENYQVIQRDISTEKKDVKVSGYYRGPNAVIQARILRYDDKTELIPWTDIPQNGARFNGVITVPQGGWYLMETRAAADDGTVMEYNSPNKFGVGINILCIGQSNMVGIGALASNTAANTDGRTSYTAASDLSANFSNGSWKHLADPYDNNAGSMIPSLANELTSKYNIPIGFVPAAASGSGLAVDPNNQWPNWITRNANDHYQYSSLNIYGRSLQRAEAAGGVELIIMNQGEHDVSIGTSSKEYARMLKQLHEYYKEDLYEDIPMFVGQLGASGSTIDAYKGKDDIMTGIRNAQRSCDNDKTLFLASTEMDLAKNKDEIHYNLTSLDILGKRMANSIMYYFGDSSYYRGPQITDAAFYGESRDIIDVHISHSGGSDFMPVDKITGFEVLANNINIDIVSADKIDSDTIRLTLSEPVGESFTLRYLYGNNPDVSGILKDNSPLHLPLEGTIINYPEENTNRSLKVLAIGNSFSADALEWLYNIADSYGYDDIVLGNAYIGGCSLETHRNNSISDSAAYTYHKNTSGKWISTANRSLSYCIKNEDWDLITLQQASGNSGMLNTYEPYLTELIDYVNNTKTNPDAQIAWHTTWAYAQNSTHVAFAQYHKSQTEMYNSIISTVKNSVLPKTEIAFDIPVGTAIQNVRTSAIGDTLNRDGYHLDYKLGRYIAGLTWFAKITGQPIDDISYVPDASAIPAHYLKVVKECVKNAIDNSYEITQSQYTDFSSDT